MRDHRRMNERVQELELWMQARESEHFEFKEAKQRYDFEELVKYCVALANEGGGKMILELLIRYHVASPARRLLGILSERRQA